MASDRKRFEYSSGDDPANIIDPVEELVLATESLYESGRRVLRPDIVDVRPGTRYTDEFGTEFKAQLPAEYEIRKRGATSGTWQLLLQVDNSPDEVLTAALAHNATPSQIQTAIVNALGTVSGNVVVTGTTFNDSDPNRWITIRFTGALSESTIVIRLWPSSTVTGGSALEFVTHSQGGGWLVVGGRTPVCRLTFGAFSIPNASNTLIPFSIRHEDPWTMNTLPTNPGLVTIPVTGKYLILMRAKWSNSVPWTGTGRIFASVNDASFGANSRIGSVIVPGPAASTETTMNLVLVKTLMETDVLRFGASHSHSSAVTLQPNDDGLGLRSSLEIQLLSS